MGCAADRGPWSAWTDEGVRPYTFAGCVGGDVRAAGCVYLSLGGCGLSPLLVIGTVGGFGGFDLFVDGRGRGSVERLVFFGFEVGDVADHFGGVELEVDATGVADGDVEGAEDEFGALDFDGAADEGVDDLHDGGLDGFGALELGDVMEARVGEADGAVDALVEVAELLFAESGGVATDSVDLDMSAGIDGHNGLTNFFIVTS